MPAATSPPTRMMASMIAAVRIRDLVRPIGPAGSASCALASLRDRRASPGPAGPGAWSPA